MRDDLQPLFESRETRLGAMPPEARDRLSLVAKQAADSGDKDFEDREFASLWLSRRLGVPRTDVAKNFNAIAGRFFGEGVTAAGAYDSISKYYQIPKPEEETDANGKPIEKEPEEGEEAVTGYRKAGQGAFLYHAEQIPKAFGAGATSTMAQVPAGLYSQLSTLTSRRLKSYYDDPEYLEMMRENAWLDPIAEADDYRTIQTPAKLLLETRTTAGEYQSMSPAKQAAWREKAQAVKSRVDAENLAALKEWDGSFRGSYSNESKRLADFWYQVAAGADQTYKLDPAFAKTTLGYLAKSAGSVPATAVLAASGPGGMLAMESMFFAQAETERQQAEGSAYDPRSAMAGNLATAIPQMVLERALGVERILSKALTAVPKRGGGKVLFGDYAKQFVKTSFESAVGEGIEEPMQGAWSDFVASLTYDENREIFTGEGAKRRLVEAYSGFILGGMFGGGVTALQIADESAARSKGEKYLTTKDGTQYTDADFRVLRSVRSDEEIRAGAVDAESGDILVRAANGDEAAQKEYNKRVVDAVFVDTNGFKIGEASLGEVGGVPVIRFDDQTIEPIDLNDPEHVELLGAFQEEAAKQIKAEEEQAEESGGEKQDERAQRQQELEETFALLKPDAELRESASVYEKLKNDLAVQEAASKPSSNESQLVQPLGEKLDAWADAKLKEAVQGGKLYSGIDPELVAAVLIKTVKDVRSGVMAFAEWSAKMIEKLGKAIEPKLANLWQAMRGPIATQEADFEITGQPQNAQQAIEAKLMRVQAKRRAATGALLAAIAKKQPLPERSKASRRYYDAGILTQKLVPISTRAGDISQDLKYKVLRKFELQLGQQNVADSKAVAPFLKGLERMGKNDAIVLDLALKNGDTETRDQIFKAYNLEEEFAAVEKVFKQTRARAIAAGFEVGEIENYFPRHVLDLDGLMNHYYGRDQLGVIEQALKEARAKAITQGRGGLSLEEREEVTNSALRGYRPKKDGKPSNLKERKVDVVDMEANQFYSDPAHALLRYIGAMNAAVAKKKFFGKHAQMIAAADTGVNQRINLDASIGSFVESLVDSGKIDAKQQQELMTILDARFNQTISSEFVNNFRTLALLTTMGRVTSTLTQLTDMMWAIYYAGAFETGKAAGRAVAGKSKIKLEDVGIDQIAEEFRDVGKLQKLLSGVFKVIGLRYMDAVGKETLMNATFASLQKQIRTGKLDPKAKKMIEQSFDAEDAPRVMREILKGEKNEDTMLAVYNVLADIAPVSPSEYPQGYLKANFGKLFYTLRSYTIKQIDTFRREAVTKIMSGEPAQVKAGFKNLAHLSALMLLIGLPVDWLKDFIMGREPRLPDLAVDQLFKIMAVNRYSLYKFRAEKDPVKFVMSLVAPPAPFLQAPANDAIKAVMQGDDIKPGEFESWKIIPIVGDPWYWWAGGGRSKIQDKLAKERNKKLRKRRNYGSR